MTDLLASFMDWLSDQYGGCEVDDLPPLEQLKREWLASAEAASKTEPVYKRDPRPIFKMQWAQEPFNLTCTGVHPTVKSKQIPMGAWLFWVDSTTGAALCLHCATKAGHRPPLKGDDST